MRRDSNKLMDVINWAHSLLSEVIEEGDFVIDLTAGRGHDTLWLAKQVNAKQHGSVLAFDIQQQAITSTAKRLTESELPVTIIKKQPITTEGITLYHGCHSQLKEHLNSQTLTAKAVIANFGYLPNSDHLTTTTAQSSCCAISAATELLSTGGRIALVIYTGHQGAQEEASAIEAMCNNLDGKQWNILRLQPVNRTNAPYLLVLERSLTTK